MPRRTRKSDWHQKPRKRKFTEFELKEQEPCPRPDKYKYHSQDDAEQFINTLFSRRTRQYGSHYLPNRSYHCRCGYWHVTSHAFVPSKNREQDDT